MAQKSVGETLFCANLAGRRTAKLTKALSHSLLGTLPDSRLAPLLGS